MGNKESRKNCGGAVEEQDDKVPDNMFESTSPDNILSEVTDSLREGKELLLSEDCDGAYNAFRYAFALIGMYTEVDFITENNKKELLEVQLNIANLIQNLISREQNEEELKNANELAKTQSKPISMKSMNLPKHVADALNNPKKKNDTNEEASAFQRLIDNVEVCIPLVKMDDVIGQKEAIQSVRTKLLGRSKVQMLKKKGHVQGLMFFGPPGNGKTTIAKAVADELGDENMTFFKVSVSNLLSKYVGQTEITIGALFKLAQLNGPSIIFFDEVEALFKSRESSAKSDSTGSGIVQLLLDMVSSNRNVFILSATNYPWLVDEAFYRRFKPVHIKMPTREDRLQMLKKIFKGENHILQPKDFKEMADRSNGFSFDDLNVVVEDMKDTAHKITALSKHFRVTKCFNDNETTITPCISSEPGAMKMSMSNIPPGYKVLLVPVTREIMIRCFDKYTPTVTEDTIRKHNIFDEKGRQGVLDLMK